MYDRKKIRSAQNATDVSFFVVSVPDDGFNETTHHVLLHGLSPLPLPNRVHTLSSHTVGHVHTPLIHPL